VSQSEIVAMSTSGGPEGAFQWLESTGGLLKITSKLSLFLTIAALLMAASVQAHATDIQCSVLFSASQNQSENLSPADLDQAIQNFAKMRIRLDLAKASGRANSVTVRLTSDFKKKEQELERFLEKQRLMSREELAVKIKQEIARLQVVNGRSEIEDGGRKKEQRKEIEKQYLEAIDGTVAIFNLVEPGSAVMEIGDKKGMVTIDRPYELMATPVTQIIWRRVAELAVKRFSGTHHIDLNPNPSAFRGDTRPVESVNLAEVEDWIDELNDLSAAGEPELEKIIHGHKTGDVYRLPTSMEWEFVVRGCGTRNDQFWFGNDDSLVDQYAWWSGNSGEETHPVAEKLPIRIGQSRFYDMLGNVGEWTDSVSEFFGATVVDTRGGSWDSISPWNMRSGSVNFQKPDTYSQSIGFRLVRDVK
jgi:hypothetical protein